MRASLGPVRRWVLPSLLTPPPGFWSSVGNTALMRCRQLKEIASLLDRERLHGTLSPRCAPDLTHRVGRQRVATHRHREHLVKHAPGDPVVRPPRSTRAVASSTTPVLASISRRPHRRGLMIRGSALWYPVKVCDEPPRQAHPRALGSRSASLLTAASHPVLPSSCTVMFGSAPPKPSGRL
jgi:hypothetical protein